MAMGVSAGVLIDSAVPGVGLAGTVGEYCMHWAEDGEIEGVHLCTAVGICMAVCVCAGGCVDGAVPGVGFASAICECSMYRVEDRKM